MLLYLFPIRLCKGKQFLCYFFIVYHSCEQWEEVRGASHLTSPARVPLQCLSGVSASSTNRHLTGVWQPGKVVILEWTWLKVSQLFLCSVFYSPHSLDRLLNPRALGSAGHCGGAGGRRPHSLAFPANLFKSKNLRIYCFSYST